MVAPTWTGDILPHPSDPSRVWVVETREAAPDADWGGVYYSDDGGASFLPFGLVGADLGAAALDPEGGWIYVVRLGHGLLRRPLADE